MFIDTFNGWGKMTYSNGSVYEGEWLNGSKQGVGCFTENGISTYSIYKDNSVSKKTKEKKFLQQKEKY